jgi:hypothetical protein
MVRRRWLALAVLLVWGGTLGWHVKRLYFRPLAALLAEAARTIPPGVAYYAVFQGDRRVGWAQTEVDTLPAASGFLLRDRLEIREALTPGTDPLSMTVEARLGPMLGLQTFRVETAGIPGIRQVEGEVRGDSVLDLRITGDQAARETSLPLDEPMVLAAAWPLSMAAQRDLKPGDQLRLNMFDPLASATRLVDLTVLAQEQKTFPDSVTAVDGLWVSAREDTVTAWWIEQDVSGIRLRSWVDEDGRLLIAEAPGGLRLERTAFEFAFFGDSVPAQLPGRLGRGPTQ